MTYSLGRKENKKMKAKGQLVWLGFDVTIFTPATYQSNSLLQPRKISS